MHACMHARARVRPTAGLQHARSADRPGSSRMRSCSSGVGANSWLLAAGCCRPQVIEMLKGGWIQWLATYLVLWWLLQWAEWLVFHFRLLSVRVASDFTPKAQRF